MASENQTPKIPCLLYSKPHLFSFSHYDQIILAFHRIRKTIADDAETNICTLLTILDAKTVLFFAWQNAL